MWFSKVAVSASLAATVAAGPVEHIERSVKRDTIKPFTTYNGTIYTSAPKYPSPWGRGSGNWSAAYERATAFVAQMTLEEKVNVTTGVGWANAFCVGQTGAVPRLGLHSLCLQDSPLGVRFADYVTAFPAQVNVAATWDRDLARQRGVAMGQEMRDKGVDIQLGPVVGPLGRAPEGGRNWEGFAPDPYLSGQLVAPTVEGIQSQGVIACTKHYIGNEQEHFRQAGEAQGYGFNITESISSNIDDQTMHELYLWPFADAVRAGTGSIMCSYNQINNSYGCSNSYTQNYLLKNELDFQGFIMSDWGAQHSGVSDALAGLDMTMPGDSAFDSGVSYWGGNLTVAVLNGTVPQYRIDDMAVRIMAAYYYVDRDSSYVPVNFDSWSRATYGKIYNNDPNSPIGLINQHVNVRSDHAQLVRDIGVKSTVLLKNNGALPLTGTEKWTTIVGNDAGSNKFGINGCPPGDHGCANGTVAMGWGSGTCDFPYVITPENAITNYIQSKGNGEVFTITQNWAESQIVTASSQASVCLVFANSDSGEGYISWDNNEGDRNNITLWSDANRVVQNVTSVCNNTIVIMHTVGAVDISEWNDNENVTGIIWAGLPGQETGNSIVDILYGLANPGGKLPFTMAPRDEYTTDVLYIPNNGQFGAPQLDFNEGLLIDYRGFDANDITPTYEFGFGLTYTTFEYSDLVITPTSASPYTPTTGESEAAPTYGSIDNNTQDYVYPSGFNKLPLWIYPYLNSSDLATSANSSDYGLPSSQWLPADSADASAQPLPPAGGAPGGNEGLWAEVATVSCTVANTGSVEGDEIAQLYVGLTGAGQPPKQLRGFERQTLAPGASSTFTFSLQRRDVSTWDTVSQNWVMQDSVTIYVGASSRILPLTGTLNFSGSSSSQPSGGMSSAGSSATASYGSSPVSQISDGQPQAPTGNPVTQISDGQPQAPTATKTN